MSQDPHADSLGSPQLDYEAWRESLRQACARYNPEGIEPSAFAGWVRQIDVCGFKAAGAGSNAVAVERDHRDIRFDGADHYSVLCPLGGQRLMITQNERAISLGVGDVALIDTARPAKLRFEHALGLNLPRQELVAYLGNEPQGGLVGRSGTPAARLLLELIRSANQEPAREGSSANSYMRFVVYDLVGALFAPSDRSSGSRHADKLFTRVRDIINQGYAAPDFGPVEVAARVGISLRYLQKLFTQRNSTCNDFIYSLRLDLAARLLRRRESLHSGQPLGEIAYACGFRDYTHFARKFRHRFGHPPGAHAAKDAQAVNARARPDHDERMLALGDHESALT